MRWRVAFGLILILLVLDSLLAGVSAASLSYSQSISFYGTIMNPTPTPTPTGPYSYIISVSGSNYQMTDGTTGQIVFQSTNSSQVFSNVVGNCSVGSSIDVASGVYTVNTMWLINGINGITLNFESGAELVAGNGLNASVLFLNNANNCVISGVTINGNAANNPVTGSFPNVPNGIYIAGSNNEVDNAIIYNCRVHGVEIWQYVLSGSPVISTHSGVINSKIYDCGWNGFTIGDTAVNCYLLNTEIYGCGDVGATTYGVGTQITGNYIHDMNGTTGFDNAQWGIGIEGGYNDVIMQNTLQNCAVGVYDNGFNNCTISGNTITNSSSGVGGIMLSGANYNTINNNYVTSTIGSGGNGIYLVSSNFNEISGNYISQCYSDGIQLDSASDNNTLSLNYVFDNSIGHAGWWCGIDIFGSNNYISQNQVYDDRSGASRTQGYGIAMEIGALNNILTGNNVYNNVYDNIADSNVPENTMINNTGYNPVGYIASPISGSSAYLVDSGSNSTWISGMVYTNTGSPKVLNIAGGTVSVVAQNGVTLFTATGCTVTLQPGDTFSVTFSTAPTINVIGQ